MNQRSHYALPLLAAAAAFLALQGGDDLIEWKEDRKLTWDDFRGKPDEGISYKALTDYKISFSSALNPNDYGKKGPAAEEVTYDVRCVFNRNSSWRKNDVTDELLRHEQTHFDIAELHARLLRKSLGTIRKADAASKKAASQSFDSIMRDCLKMQNLYDRETDHSRNREKQKEWEARIAKELKKTEKYRRE